MTLSFIAVDCPYKYNDEGLGWHQFMSLDKLREAYLDKEGSLKIEVEFEVVSTTKSSQ